MQNLAHKEMHIKLNTEELSPTQVRLVKGINALLAHVLTADEESEYFEASSELMKKVAELIKYSQFAMEHKDMCYGEQAVEFAIEFLNETLDQSKLHNIDN